MCCLFRPGACKTNMQEGFEERGLNEKVEEKRLGLHGEKRIEDFYSEDCTGLRLAMLKGRCQSPWK